MSIHDDHRQRVRQRFLESGLDDFHEIQVLELLLFYCIPRRDTNPVAHALLEHFGSFSQVMEAPVEELKKVKGMGESSAAFLHLVTAVSRYYQVDRVKQVKILPTIEDCGRYLIPFFHGRRNETVFLLCMDAKCKVICCKEIGEGSVNSAGVPIRRIVETALGVSATTVVLAHNHPSGVALPSDNDRAITLWVRDALKTMDIRLSDHIIVADDDFVSMNQSGYLL